MRRAVFLICVALSICIVFAQNNSSNMKINFRINDGRVLEVTLVDNSSSRALVEQLRKGPISYISSPYGGFESVGDIGVTLPQSDTRITTSACDVVLYQGHNICLYYDVNTWSFTRLGRVTNATQSELRNLLGSQSVSVTMYLDDSGVDVINADYQVKEIEKGIYTLDGLRLNTVPEKGFYIEDGVKKIK